MFGNAPSGWRKPATRAALILGAVAVSASAAFAAADVAAGKTLFLQKCSVCHKQDATGGITFGDTKSANLTEESLEQLYHKDAAKMKASILDGVDEEGGPLDKVMPRWKGKITDAQADDVVAYLLTLTTK